MATERTGGIVNRGGKLYARVTYVEQFGKRKEITRNALDRADAQQIIAELHARIDQHGGEAVLNDRSPLADVIEQYRQEKAQPAEIRDGKKISGLKSHYNFGKMLNVLVEHLGKKILRDLKPVDLHRFKQKRLRAIVITAIDTAMRLGEILNTPSFCVVRSAHVVAGFRAEPGRIQSISPR